MRSCGRLKVKDASWCMTPATSWCFRRFFGSRVGRGGEKNDGEHRVHLGTFAAKTIGITHIWKFHAFVGIDLIGWFKGFHGVIARPSRSRRRLVTLRKEEKKKTEATLPKKERMETEASESK